MNRLAWSGLLVISSVLALGESRGMAAVGDLIAQLTAEDAEAGQELGDAVAVSTGVAIAGAVEDRHAGSNSGAAYLFDATSGQQLFKLVATDAAADHEFGGSVGISGNLAIVGAEEAPTGNGLTGAAYLFDVSTGQQVRKLAAEDTVPDDDFGQSVAIDRTLAVVGSENQNDEAGAAYVFDITTGEQLHKLLPNPFVAGQEFGAASALDGDIAIIGTDKAPNAYLFDLTTGEQLFQLTSNDPMAGTEDFGSAVDISGNRAIVNGTMAAFIFDVETGTETMKLVPDDPDLVDVDFETPSVAIDGDFAVMGVIPDDTLLFSPAAYVFDLTTGQQVAKLLSTDAESGGGFGSSAGMGDGLIVVGDPTSNRNAGTAFTYEGVAAAPVPLRAGDADQNLQFDQLDLVKVQVAAKYLTGQPATWGEGDWDSAPGGERGNPPQGNGKFDQFDIIAAQQAGIYLTGPYGPLEQTGQQGGGQTSAVPEPSSVLLALFGLAGLLTSLRARRAEGPRRPW
jgi:outer membrane protein assembly factor BamB